MQYWQRMAGFFKINMSNLSAYQKDYASLKRGIYPRNVRVAPQKKIS